MGILTPASPDILPPLGELIANEPFLRYPTDTTREGIVHLRVWLTVGPKPGHLAVVTQAGSAPAVTESAEQIWAGLARGCGPRSCCSNITRHPRPETARRPSTWSGSAPTAARTGWACGRPHRTIPARRARIVDGRSRPPDRRHARELVRLVPELGRLNYARPELHL